MNDPHIQQRERLMYQFIKIGTRIISLNQVAAVDLKSVDMEGVTCVEISLTSTENIYFHEEEAETVTKFFTAGNRTYDLDNLYGGRNS